MSSFDVLELCFRNLMRRRTRTLLAITGVVVGTCAIIVMLSVGFGLSVSYQAQVESYGNLHMIEVYGGRTASAAPTNRNDDNGIINDRTLVKMEKLEGVTAVTPVLRANLNIVLGKKTASYTQVLGLKPDVLEKFGFEVSEGRLLSASDKNAILFGSQIPYYFRDPNRDIWTDTPEDVTTDKLILTGDQEYGRKNTTGNTGDQKVVYKEYKIKGIGVLANENDESAYSAYMKIDELEKIQKEIWQSEGVRVPTGGAKTYENALVYVGDINDTESVIEELKAMEYQTYSPTEWLSAMKQTARMIQGVLGGIGGISLFVAALGITNTMIMSIYERTKEIGVMKVIGANLRDIRKLFLLEAGMIGSIGGIIGILFSIVISLLMNTVLKEAISMGLGNIGGGYGDTPISIIPWWVMAAAFAFATGIGMAAGFYPAKRAMNLSALESLRNE